MCTRAGVGAAAPLIALASLTVISSYREPSRLLLATVAAFAALIAFAAWVGGKHPRAAAATATISLLGTGAVCVPGLTAGPGTALMAGLGLMWLMYVVWRPKTDARPPWLFRPSGSEVAAAAGTAGTAALAAWFMVVGIGLDAAGYGAVLAGAAEAVAAGFTALWTRSASAFHRRMTLAFLGLSVAVASIFAVAGWLSAALTVGVLPAMTAIALAAVRRTEDVAGTWNEIFNNPARLLIVTFLLLCIVGTILLSLPVCATDDTRLPLVDAAFTAVSAVCVTGLIVRDTPHEFSRAGQLVILLLIQLGGLGIMAFTTAAMGLLGRRMSMHQERIAAELLNERNRTTLFTSLRRTLLVTFGFELAAIPVLAVAFARHNDAAFEALWRGVFTTVSAFCNAGFSLQTESLIPYQTSGVILHVTGLLIVAGGLSPFVIAAIPGLLRGLRPDLRTRVILFTTGLLLAAGFCLVLALEWGASLGGLSLVDKVNNAWFQCLTPRTAGFNSVDMGELRPATLTIFMILMFIGGSPGGTAGGIKTTTFFVLAMAIVSVMRGRAEIQVFNRRIPHSTLYRAAAIATLGIVAVAGALIAIQVTQKMPADKAIFEVVSALGTVGLSTGGTPLLDGVGKVIIMICMFLGRVGPLTAFLFLSDRQTAPTLRAPEEKLQLG